MYVARKSVPLANHWDLFNAKEDGETVGLSCFEVQK